MFNDNSHIAKTKIFFTFLSIRRIRFFYTFLMNFINKQITGMDSQVIGSLNGETDDKIGSSLHKSFRSSYWGNVPYDRGI